MNILEIPEDIWLEIFSFIPSEKLFLLQRVCTRFRTLLARPLLHHIFWMTHEQAKADISKWNIYSESLAALPRTVSISVPFGHALAQRSTTFNGLYNAIYAHLPNFTRLHTLTLDRTTFSTDIYATVAGIPTLRTLNMRHCTYFPSPLIHPSDNPVNFSAFSLSHITIEGINVPVKGYNEGLHPIMFITASTLTSLDISWTGEMAAAYEQFIQGFHGNAQPGVGAPPHANLAPVAGATQHLLPSPPPSPVPAQSLRYLYVQIPLLTRDLVRPLAHLTSPRTQARSAVARPPRVTINVAFWSLSEQQLRELDRSWQQANPGIQRNIIYGVWSYTGPSEILAVFVPVGTGLGGYGLRFLSTRAVLTSGDNADYDSDDDAADADGYQLRHLRFVPPSRDPASLVRLLWALMTTFDRQSGQYNNRAIGLASLELCLPHWDTEILFAIRSIFPNVRDVIIRVGGEVGGEELLVTLGGSILLDLPHLSTLRIVHDPISVSGVSLFRARSGYIGSDRLQIYQVQGLFDPPQSSLAEGEASELVHLDADALLEREERAMVVKDYLNGWARYCRSLRKVQLSDGLEWVRGWEGGKWNMRSTGEVSNDAIPTR